MVAGPISRIMGTQNERLRQARIAAGYSTAKQAIDAFGFQEAAYRHHENGTRAITPDNAKRYGRAFKVNPGWILGLDAKQEIELPPESSTLKVLGAVSAGVWLEQTEWAEDDQYEIEVGPSPIPGVKRFAVKMEGHSMNLIIPPGSDLECAYVDYQDGVVPQPGQLVIACREAHDLTEMTCKRLEKDGEEWILRAESSRPEFQEPIRLGRPSAHLHIDNGVRIIGIVLRAHQSHYKATAKPN